MNPCHYCGQPATIHLTSLLGKNKKVEQHLCERCARKHGVVKDDPADAAGPLDLTALVQLVMQQHPRADAASLKCPACGLKYAQFRADGRLGCPHDYDIFRPTLEPLLERIHRSVSHAGKGPRALRRRAELDDLREQLAAAVAAERYEDAARFRDLIRQKGGGDEPR